MAPPEGRQGKLRARDPRAKAKHRKSPQWHHINKGDNPMKYQPTALCMVLVAAACTAQAQSSVTIYGNVDAAITHVNLGNSQSMNALYSGVGPGGRLGFRGSEDLGDGLSANFVMESGIAADTGTYQQGGIAFGRQMWVGLGSRSGGWNLSAGRQYSPMALSLVNADTQGNAYWGNLLSVGNGVYQAPSATGADPGFQASGRVSNSLATSWSRSGLTLRGMLGAGDENSRKTGQLASASITYEANGLMVTAAATRVRQFAKDIAADAAPAWQNEWMAGASYDFGLAKLFAGYYQFNPSETNKTITAATWTKTASWWLGGRIPMPVGTLMVQSLQTTFTYPQASNGRGNTLSMVYDYPLSKRTALYASVAQLRNNAKGVSVLYGAVPILNYPAVAGTDVKAYSVGLRHSF